MYMPGDYCCVDITTGNIAGRIMDSAIRRFTNSQYNHAFIIVSEDGDIVEAQPRGAALGNISRYDGERKIFSATNLTGEQREKIVETAISCVGIPYGFLDIAYLGLASAGINWNWLLNQVLREDRMICSQLVAYCGASALADSWLCGKAHPQLVKPSDLSSLAFAETL